MSGIGQDPITESVRPAGRNDRWAPRLLILPGLLTAGFLIDYALNLQVDPYLEGVFILALVFGFVWCLIAAIRTGHRRALTIAGGVIAVLFAPIIGTLIASHVRDGMLAIASFQYDAKIKDAVESNGAKPVQMILSDQRFGFQGKIGGFSEIIVYDGSDLIHIGPKGKIAGFSPVSDMKVHNLNAKIIRISWLRDHYYRIVKNNTTYLTEIDLGGRP
jgi:hypothetical protein